MSVYQQLYNLAFQLTASEIHAHRIVAESIGVAANLHHQNDTDAMACMLVTCRNKSYDYLAYGQ